jgi:cell division protein FtsL
MATIPATFPPTVRRPVHSVAAGRANLLEVHYSKYIPNRALVPKADPATGRELTGLFAVSVLAFCVILLLMLLISRSRQAGYENETLKEQQTKAEQINARLRVEQSRLLNPRRLAGVAGKWGMVPAGPKQLIPRPSEHSPESAPENTQASLKP